MEIRDLRNGDWYWVQKEVYKKYTKKVGAIGLALYNAYCHYANNSTGIAYPSVETIAKDLIVSRKTIFKYNGILERYRLIKIISGKGRKKVNEVHLLKIKVTDVPNKVNVVPEKVNEVHTEQELLTRITNKNGINHLKNKMKDLRLI